MVFIGPSRALSSTTRLYIPLGEVWFVRLVFLYFHLVVTSYSRSSVIGRSHGIIGKVGNLRPDLRPLLYKQNAGGSNISSHFKA